MDNFNFITGLLNLAAGIFATLIGFRVLKPFNPKWQEITKYYLLVFKYGGIAIIIWGIFKMVSS
ncbi:MAG: hypothetical protein MUC73_08150 [Cyclobacteriaceae bacterium]|jgi:hypothetical protein|nr:hypothetical protein [Cyclobacteriaceae bacterium]